MRGKGCTAVQILESSSLLTEQRCSLRSYPGRGDSMKRRIAAGQEWKHFEEKQDAIAILAWHKTPDQELRPLCPSPDARVARWHASFTWLVVCCPYAPNGIEGTK